MDTSREAEVWLPGAWKTSKQRKPKPSHSEPMLRDRGKAIEQAAPPTRKIPDSDIHTENAIKWASVQHRQESIHRQANQLLSNHIKNRPNGLSASGLETVAAKKGKAESTKKHQGLGGIEMDHNLTKVLTGKEKSKFEDFRASATTTTWSNNLNKVDRKEAKQQLKSKKALTARGPSSWSLLAPSDLLRSSHVPLESHHDDELLPDSSFLLTLGPAAYTARPKPAAFKKMLTEDERSSNKINLRQFVPVREKDEEKEALRPKSPSACISPVRLSHEDSGSASEKGIPCSPLNDYGGDGRISKKEKSSNGVAAGGGVDHFPLPQRGFHLKNKLGGSQGSFEEDENECDDDSIDGVDGQMISGGRSVVQGKISPRDATAQVAAAVARYHAFGPGHLPATTKLQMGLLQQHHQHNNSSEKQNLQVMQRHHQPGGIKQALGSQQLEQRHQRHSPGAKKVMEVLDPQTVAQGTYSYLPALPASRSGQRRNLHHTTQQQAHHHPPVPPPQSRGSTRGSMGSRSSKICRGSNYGGARLPVLSPPGTIRLNRTNVLN